MRKQVCAAYAKREIIQSILIGPLSLAFGIFIATLAISTSALDFFVLHFAENFVYIFVILFLTFSGIYLLLSGLRKLFSLEATDICRYIHDELKSEGANLTGKKMLSLVDSDLERGILYGEEKIVIGQEWLFAQNAWGKPIIRLNNIRKIKESKTKNDKIILKFMDQQGVGPVTRELPTVEAGAIKSHLQRNIPDLVF